MPPNLPSYGSPHHEIEPKLDRQTTKSRGSRISYSVNAPKFPIGPTDLVSVPIHILPADPGVSIRSATLVVERRIYLNDPTSPTSSHPYQPSNSSLSTPHSPHNSLTSQSAPTSSSIPIARPFTSSSSLALPLSATPYGNEDTFTSTTALLPSHSSVSHSSESLSVRPIVTPVAGTDSSGPFNRSRSGLWSKTLTFQWPSVKSSGRWGIGESIQSDLVTVKFFVRAKVVSFFSVSPTCVDKFFRSSLLHQMVQIR